MSLVYRKQKKSWIYFLAVSLLFSISVTACASSGVRNEKTDTNNMPSKISPQANEVTSSPSNDDTDANQTSGNEQNQSEQIQLRPGEEDWVTLYPGEQADGLKFTKDGTLSYQGKVLLPKIPVSYVSDGTVKYAGRLIVSNSSPSGKFNFFKGCEESVDGASLCWALFLVNKASGKVNQPQASKYGPMQWVQWTKDERYAILADQNEGASWLHVIDLETGDSKQVQEGGWSCSTLDLKSFSWTSDRTFKVKLDHPQGCEKDAGKSAWVTGNIKDIF